MNNLERLPEWCYSVCNVSGEVIILERGVSGHRPADIRTGSRKKSRIVAAEQNAKMGVSKAQAAAMYCGCLFGFDMPGADPDRYDENGVFKVC